MAINSNRLITPITLFIGIRPFRSNIDDITVSSFSGADRMNTQLFTEGSLCKGMDLRWNYKEAYASLEINEKKMQQLNNLNWPVCLFGFVLASIELDL